MMLQPILKAPGDINIRRRGFSEPQDFAWGVPVVRNGDWVAQRPIAGHGARLVLQRQPWEAGPYIRVLARPLPAGMGDDTDVYGPFQSLLSQVVGATQGGVEVVEENVAERVTASVMEQLRPYLIWGGIGVVGLVGIVGYMSYALGRSS